MTAQSDYLWICYIRLADEIHFYGFIGFEPHQAAESQIRSENGSLMF